MEVEGRAERPAGGREADDKRNVGEQRINRRKDEENWVFAKKKTRGEEKVSKEKQRGEKWEQEKEKQTKETC